MRSLILFVILLAACAPKGVPVSDLLPVAEELGGQAGTAYQETQLLNLLDRSHPTPDERAEIARQRCKLDHAMRGAAAALPGCRAAAELGHAAGLRAAEKSSLRLALVLIDDPAHAEEGLRLANGLPQPTEPIDQALVLWARGQGRLALRQPAVDEMLAAYAAVEAAVQRDPKRAEFLAIADYRLGQALAAVGRVDQARIALRRGVAHQRQLDAENPEYAEYRLYLVRLLWALGDLPGEDAARAEAQRLAQELLRRDPQRAQYQAEVR